MLERTDGGQAQPALIVGSIGLDTVQTPFGSVTDALGGAASYAAAAASFYAPVRLVGVVGEDFPSPYLELLKARGVDLAGVEVRSGRTFRWSGYYEYDLNTAHTVSTHLNVFESFRPRLPEAYRDSPYLFLANIDPELQLSVLEQVLHPALTLCDTMNYWIESKRKHLLAVLERVDVVLLNDAEARQLCDTTNLVAAARSILGMGPRAVIIKKGEHGAVMCTGRSHFSAPSFPLEEVRDPTGAGDSFAGGLVGFLAYAGDPCERNLRKAIVFGSVMASYNVEDFSLNRLLSLTPELVLERYRQFHDISHFEQA